SMSPASFRPSRNARTRSALPSADVECRNPIVGALGCCARATSGGRQAHASLPNDMRAARQDFEHSWNEWADGRIAAALNQHARMYDKAVGGELGRATAKLHDEIATLRRALATARNRIKELEQQRNVKIVSWHINRKAFSPTPFDATGKPGTPL